MFPSVLSSFDTVGWMTGGASGHLSPRIFFQYKWKKKQEGDLGDPEQRW